MFESIRKKGNKVYQKLFYFVIRLSIDLLFIHISIYLSIYLSIYRSIYLCMHQCTHLITRHSTILPSLIHPFVHPSISAHPSIDSLLHPSIHSNIIFCFHTFTNYRDELVLCSWCSQSIGHVQCIENDFKNSTSSQICILNHKENPTPYLCTDCSPVLRKSSRKRRNDNIIDITCKRGRYVLRCNLSKCICRHGREHNL